MNSFAESLALFQAQISELNRLADEAQACADLLRQQAEKYRRILESEDLTQERLNSLLAERQPPPVSNAAFRLTEGLM